MRSYYKHTTAQSTVSDNHRLKLRNVPGPILRQAGDDLLKLVHDLYSVADLQDARAEERRQKQAYRRRMERAGEALGQYLDDGVDIIPATTQAAFAFNVDRRDLEILWPVLRTRWLRGRELARTRAVMGMWQNAVPIADIAKHFNISTRTVNRIVRDVRDGKLRL